MSQDLFERARKKAEEAETARAKAQQDNNPEAVDRIMADLTIPVRIKHALLRLLGFQTGNDEKDED